MFEDVRRTIELQVITREDNPVDNPPGVWWKLKEREIEQSTKGIK